MKRRSVTILLKMAYRNHFVVARLKTLGSYKIRKFQEIIKTTWNSTRVSSLPPKLTISSILLKNTKNLILSFSHLSPFFMKSKNEFLNYLVHDVVFFRMNSTGYSLYYHGSLEKIYIISSIIIYRDKDRTVYHDEKRSISNTDTRT